MNDNLFITPYFLKEDGVIFENTADDLINPVIELVQEGYIKKIIGDVLYDNICVELSSAATTVKTFELLDNYIRPVMKYYCLAEMCNAITYKFISCGKYEQKNLSPEQLKAIQNYYINHAQWYEKKLLRKLDYEKV